ncbi:hypothetical protein GCM10011534_28390 [Pseudooceanicola nanhaiensis]|jgi:biotin carboxyl carrier protein|uniref:Lipoyl-binding domain-containing protein n=1 Tax=Pseudooceanicola nanhaiensis TaxID=375761 RepID=A0A917WHA5_9RHOB|nr:acetyl-CoA carboxylase biotin carboxyl carrier protein subunit [Pseudooceanicola nanhaiensis]GGM04925.1 hypothetical protein GCM10011534_28390 [Pseudooceanicola nanhaiensis]
MAEQQIRTDVTGRVWKILRTPGEAVAEGETILIVEAMKMEIPVAAEAAGRLLRLLVAEEDEVAEDAVVAVVEVGA